MSRAAPHVVVTSVRRNSGARRRRRHEAGPRSILGRYRLTSRLATGGSAEVWRAVDEREGTAVAVKLLHPHLLPDEASRARLVAEARAVEGLDHPGIIRVLGADAGEEPAVVMELVRGRSLDAVIAEQGPLPEREAARIGAELADAMYHAHTRGVIHRDVKPGNVILGADGHARLVDFGIARLLGDAMSRTTQVGMVVGTLRYMAPEQLRGDDLSPRVDLYGLGAVLHETLTGRPPFDAVTPVALLEAETTGPRDLPGVDPALSAIVRACLQPIPEDRPLHAGAVADALRAWLDGDPAPALGFAPSASSPQGIGLHQADTRPMAAVAPVAAPVAAAWAARPGVRLPAIPWAFVRAAVGATLAALVLVIAAVGFSELRQSVALAAPTSRPTPATTPIPSWAVDLADRFRNACGSGPSARDLAALGLAEATRQVDLAVGRCHPSNGNGNGKGNGGGGGDGGGGD